MKEFEGYDENGFNKHGIHRDTGTNYDNEGYSRKGYDKDGYDRRGYDRKGYRRDGYNDKGYDRDGFNREGYNRRNFDREGINRETGGIYDINGYDMFGYNKDGYDKNGYDKDGFDREGFRRNGYNEYGYDRDGYDKNGYDKEGYDREGYNIKGYDRDGYNREGHDSDGYDREGYNIKGFKDGFTKDGYNKNGYNKDGYNREGYNRYGYGRDGYNRYGYNNQGFDREGYDRRGFNQEGYNREGYDRQGFNKQGFDKNGYDKDGYNSEGYNSRGFGKDKIHKDTGTTYDADGYDDEGFDRFGYNREGIDCLGIDSNGVNRQTGQIDERVILGKEFISSQMTIPQYARHKGKTIEEIEAQVEIARSIACIRDDVMSVLTKNSNRYIAAKLAEKDKLLEGKIEVRDVRGIEKTLALCTGEEKEKVMKLLITSIASHNITILEYKEIFAIENFNSKLPQNIIDKIAVMKGEVTRSKDAEVRKQVKEIYAEIRRLESYKTPYREGDLTKVGYSENGKAVMFDITSEHEVLAKRYLIATEEFICYKTMSNALTKIAKGDVNLEDVDKLEASRVKATEGQHESENTTASQTNIVEEASTESEQEQKRRKELLESIKASQEELAELTIEIEAQDKTSLRYGRNINGERKNE